MQGRFFSWGWVMRWFGQQESSMGFGGCGNSQIHTPFTDGW